MDGPLVGTGGAQAVVGQIDTFTDAHTGVAEQQEDISAEIVAAQQLLLEDLILLGGEWPRQSVWRARDVFTQQQVGKFGEMIYPGYLMEESAQSEEPADAGGGSQGRRLCSHMRHPSEDMRIAANLFEARNLRMFRAEIDEEAAHHGAVVALAGGDQCSAQRLDRLREDRRQRVLERRTALAHQEILG